MGWSIEQIDGATTKAVAAVKAELPQIIREIAGEDVEFGRLRPEHASKVKSVISMRVSEITHSYLWGKL